MLKEYNVKQRKRLEMYFRCLSSTCIRGLLGDTMWFMSLISVMSSSKED